jgi:hypothetical protein
MQMNETALERERLLVVVATIVINVVAVSLLTFAPWSDWRTGAALNIINNCLLVGFTIVRRDALLARFLLFGIAVGFAELPADAWLVDYTRTLDYSIGGGPIIWQSPLWMARRIHWWQYRGCRMISFTPWYIILGEFGIAIAFTLLARTLRRGSWSIAGVAGIAGGALIFVCYAAAFLITDRLIKQT